MSEPHRYVFAPRAVRDLEKLPEAVAVACVELIAGALADNPHRLGKPLLGPWHRHWSARRGGYRIIYQIDDQTRVVRVVHIDHRSQVYGRRWPAWRAALPCLVVSRSASVPPADLPSRHSYGRRLGRAVGAPWWPDDHPGRASAAGAPGADQPYPHRLPGATYPAERPYPELHQLRPRGSEGAGGGL